jgi:hypothetical protein
VTAAGVARIVAAARIRATATMGAASTQASKQALPAATTIATITTHASAVTRTIAAVTSNGFLLTAQQGDADDREKDRDTQKHSSIHPKLLEV